MTVTQDRDLLIFANFGKGVIGKGFLRFDKPVFGDSFRAQGWKFIQHGYICAGVGLFKGYLQTFGACAQNKYFSGVHSVTPLEKLNSAHPQTASFGPGRRFRSFEILKIARYSSGFKIAQALPQTKIYYLWTDTNYKIPCK